MYIIYIYIIFIYIYMCVFHIYIYIYIICIYQTYHMIHIIYIVYIYIYHIYIYISSIWERSIYHMYIYIYIYITHISCIYIYHIYHKHPQTIPKKHQNGDWPFFKSSQLVSQVSKPSWQLKSASLPMTAIFTAHRNHQVVTVTPLKNGDLP